MSDGVAENCNYQYLIFTWSLISLVCKKNTQTLIQVLSRFVTLPPDW